MNLSESFASAWWELIRACLLSPLGSAPLLAALAVCFHWLCGFLNTAALCCPSCLNAHLCKAFCSSCCWLASCVELLVHNETQIISSNNKTGALITAVVWNPTKAPHPVPVSPHGSFSGLDASLQLPVSLWRSPGCRDFQGKQIVIFFQFLVFIWILSLNSLWVVGNLSVSLWNGRGFCWMLEFLWKELFPHPPLFFKEQWLLELHCSVINQL